MKKSHKAQIYFIVFGLVLSLVLFLYSINHQNNVVDVSDSGTYNTVWRDVYFSETHGLNTPNPCVLYEVIIDDIFKETYPQGNSDECLVLICSLKKVFYQSPTNEHNFINVNEDDTIFIWIDIDHYDLETVSSLTSLFETLDSAIVYGYQTTPYFIQGTSDCRQLEKELGAENVQYINFDGLSMLNLPPSVIVYNLNEWTIMPIIDGGFDADSLTSIIGVENMAFDVSTENIAGRQYFKNGDSIDQIYEALKKFVNG